MLGAEISSFFSSRCYSCYACVVSRVYYHKKVIIKEKSYSLIVSCNTFFVYFFCRVFRHIYPWVVKYFGLVIKGSPVLVLQLDITQIRWQVLLFLFICPPWCLIMWFAFFAFLLFFYAAHKFHHHDFMINP